MFTPSLLESPAGARRGWITFLSFVMEAMAIAALVALPLFYTQALPPTVDLSPLIGPPPGNAQRGDSSERRSARGSTPEVIGSTVREPVFIRKGVADIRDHGSPEPVPDLGESVWGSTGSRDGGRSIMSVIGAPPQPPAPPPAATTRPLPVSSGVLQGFLIQQVRPIYPPLAIAARVQGTVVLNAVISRAGTIENLHVVSGHPLLVRAALEAVEHWRYRPYLLNGEPVEVETQITVNFTLGG